MQKRDAFGSHRCSAGFEAISKRFRMLFMSRSSILREGTAIFSVTDAMPIDEK